jgi:hypothetical protein
MSHLLYESRDLGGMSTLCRARHSTCLIPSSVISQEATEW